MRAPAVVGDGDGVRARGQRPVDGGVERGAADRAAVHRPASAVRAAPSPTARSGRVWNVGAQRGIAQVDGRRRAGSRCAGAWPRAAAGRPRRDAHRAPSAPDGDGAPRRAARARAPTRDRRAASRRRAGRRRAGASGTAAASAGGQPLASPRAGRRRVASRPESAQIGRGARPAAGAASGGSVAAGSRPRTRRSRGQQHVVEDRRRAGHARRVPQRRAIEVADPHPDRHLAREADRPVVAVGLRRARLHRHREREVEAAAAAEHPGARASGSERMSVTQKAARAETSGSSAAARRGSATPPSRTTRRTRRGAAPRRRRAPAPRRRPRARPGAPRRRPWSARSRSGRRVLSRVVSPARRSRRSRSGTPTRDSIQTAGTFSDPARAEPRAQRAAEDARRSSAGCRGRPAAAVGKCAGTSGSTVAGVKPALEGEGVGERLERGAGLARGDDAVDGAAVRPRRRSRPSLPRPATPPCALSSTATATLCAPCAVEPRAVHGQDARHLALQRGVERGLDAARGRLPRRGQHALHEVRRQRRRGARARCAAAPARAASQPRPRRAIPAPPCARAPSAGAARAASRWRYGIERGRAAAGRPARSAACAGRQVRRRACRSRRGSPPPRPVSWFP